MGGTHGTMSCTQNRKGAGLCLQEGGMWRQADNAASVRQAFIKSRQGRAGRAGARRAGRRRAVPAEKPMRLGT